MLRGQRTSRSKAPAPVWVGTAGWSVPTRYAVDFPYEGKNLERYARRLNAVEINSSFHRPHQRSTYLRWAQSTPAGFRFSVKVPKTITHEQRLVDCGALLDHFIAEVRGLGDKLGVLLVQLPGKFAFEEKIADAFFRDLRARVDQPIALEPRNESWFSVAVDDWLAECGITRVAADPARAITAGEPGGWNGMAYYRLHGC